MNGTICRPGGFASTQRMRAGVRAAGREDAGDAVLFEQRQHLVDAVIGLRLPIVVHMGVEDFDRLVRAAGRAAKRQRRSGTAMHARPPGAHRPPEQPSFGGDHVRPPLSPVSSSCGSSLRCSAAVDAVEIDVDHRA